MGLIGVLGQGLGPLQMRRSMAWTKKCLCNGRKEKVGLLQAHHGVAEIPITQCRCYVHIYFMDEG